MAFTEERARIFSAGGMRRAATTTTTTMTGTHNNRHLLLLSSVHPQARLVLPDMVQRKSGHVIFTSSVYGLISMPYVATYCAAKFAITGLVYSLRQELKARAATPGSNEEHCQMFVVWNVGVVPACGVAASALLALPDRHTCCMLAGCAGHGRPRVGGGPRHGRRPRGRHVRSQPSLQSPQAARRCRPRCGAEKAACSATGCCRTAPPDPCCACCAPRTASSLPPACRRLQHRAPQGRDLHRRQGNPRLGLVDAAHHHHQGTQRRPAAPASPRPSICPLASLPSRSALPGSRSAERSLPPARHGWNGFSRR